jgi:hypothetical protein
VKQPDTDDLKKLNRVISYLYGTKALCLTLEANNLSLTKWWVDGSYAIHPDMRSHTGATMSLGKGSIYSSSLCQKLTTKISTEAEIVAVSDVLPQVIWTQHFLTSQGYSINKSVVFQDNKSAISLEKNSRVSSGKRTRHRNIRYFFITDRVKTGDIKIEHCPTQDMLGDYFTKPSKGINSGNFVMPLLTVIFPLPGEIIGVCCGYIYFNQESSINFKNITPYK